MFQITKKKVEKIRHDHSTNNQEGVSEAVACFALNIVALPLFCMHLVTEPKTMLQVNAVSQSQLAQEFLKKDYHAKIQVKLRKSI